MLESKIIDLYGERCPTYDPDCAICTVWELMDTIARLKEASLEYMSQFGQGLTANGIPLGPAQIKADNDLREVLSTKPVPCAHIADYYQLRWENHKCIGYNLLRQGYSNWSNGGIIYKFNNLYGDKNA